MLSETSLKRLVIFQGVLLVGGLILVVATIVYQSLYPKEGTPTPAVSVPEIAGERIAVPPGTELRGYTSDGKVLILHLKIGEGRDRILVVEVASGRTLGDYVVVPE